MEHLDPHAETVAEVVGAHRDHHELLGVHIVAGVGAAVEDVHERHREDPRHRPAQVPVQRKSGLIGGRARRGERDCQYCVGTEATLVGRVVGVHHLRIDQHLVGGIHPFEARPQHFIHVPDGVEHTLPAIARVVPIAKFHGLVLAGRRTAGNRRAARGTAGKQDFGFDRGIAPAVEDFAGVNVDDGGHAARGLESGGS